LTEPVAVTAVVDTALWAVFPFQKSGTEMRIGHRPVATVVTRSGLWTGNFCILGFLFLRLTNYGGNCLKFFVIAQIH
jgi:hypothetical protein